jgi:biopolymer transport protein ExbD/biopolymer transport protein TolR
MAFEVSIGKGSKRGKREQGRAVPNMNVTPLVDVVLVLLIIFLVITPMMAKQFWLVLPQKPDKQETLVKEPDEKDKAIVVTLSGTGEIRINHDVIAKDTFSDKLHRVLAAAGERTIFFDADSAAKFGRAMEVMDIARHGGAAHIVVLTEPVAIR